MKIDQYISQLLYRYQCVTVPGFGAFLTEIQSAQLHEGSHSFYPPKKLVSFNSYLKNNDGLLANHIAQAEKMSYEVAVSAIENQVTIWKSKLHDFGAITLKNIGEISLNQEKNLVFVPYDQLNYLTASFGLTTYISPAVKREIFKEELQELQETTTINFTPETKKGTNFLKYAAIFVLGAGLLGAGGFLGNNYYQAQIEQQTVAVQAKVQKQVEQKIQEATFFISSPLPSVTLSVSNSKMPYHIVAGAFRQEENALKIYSELLKLGYPAKRIPKNKHGLYPVVYGSFSSYSEAQKEMQKIQKSHNPEAWLLIEEL
ncbi:SPOR domain-containing protein [Flavobacterium sp.]|uniref:HU domain-containing protein n=1 Tax=Flavobacterium sp. TaxID=239 RepID=UPI0037530D9D